MLYTLNNNYVLRQELNDCYRLYNKKTLRRVIQYRINYSLFLSNLENNLILLNI